MDYVSEGVLAASDAEKAEGSSKNPLSSTGFVNALATGTHGGVIADGGIRRDATLALSALKLLRAGDDEETCKLQRYILGLALVAFTKLPLGYYRQGTILVLDPDMSREFSEVALNGARTPATFSHESALAFAQAAANAFGVGESREVAFNKDTAKKNIAEAKKKKGKE